MPPALDVRPSVRLSGLGVFVRVAAAEGEAILTFAGPIESASHPHTLQVGPREFMGRSGGPDDFVNHACDPNTAFAPGTLTLVARRPLHAGEEVTFDYCSADWDQGEHGFTCRCGSAACRGTVRGYRWLTAAERGRVPSPLPYLLELIPC